MENGARQPVDLTRLRPWAFLTHHAQVLLALVREPALTVRELADAVQITERSTYRILADLEAAGFLRRAKAGRRNLYEVNGQLPLGDPVVEHDLVGVLFEALRRDAVSTPALRAG